MPHDGNLARRDPGADTFGPVSQASLPDMLSLVHAAALAGTGVSVANDWEATYQNPAGLGRPKPSCRSGSSTAAIDCASTMRRMN